MFRRPIAAFGNSDGDLQMLQWVCSGNGKRFCLYVHHTDAAREWAYDRNSHIGRLDKGLDEAKTEGWSIVDMNNDWKRIYPIINQQASHQTGVDYIYLINFPDWLVNVIFCLLRPKTMTAP